MDSNGDPSILPKKPKFLTNKLIDSMMALHRIHGVPAEVLAENFPDNYRYLSEVLCVLPRVRPKEDGTSSAPPPTVEQP